MDHNSRKKQEKLTNNPTILSTLNQIKSLKSFVTFIFEFDDDGKSIFVWFPLFEAAKVIGTKFLKVKN